MSIVVRAQENGGGRDLGYKKPYRSPQEENDLQCLAALAAVVNHDKNSQTHSLTNSLSQFLQSSLPPSPLPPSSKPLPLYFYIK